MSRIEDLFGRAPKRPPPISIKEKLQGKVTPTHIESAPLSPIEKFIGRSVSQVSKHQNPLLQSKTLAIFNRSVASASHYLQEFQRAFPDVQQVILNEKSAEFLHLVNEGSVDKKEVDLSLLKAAEKFLQEQGTLEERGVNVETLELLNHATSQSRPLRNEKILIEQQKLKVRSQATKTVEKLVEKHHIPQEKSDQAVEQIVAQEMKQWETSYSYSEKEGRMIPRGREYVSLDQVIGPSQGNLIPKEREKFSVLGQVFKMKGIEYDQEKDHYICTVKWEGKKDLITLEVSGNGAVEGFSQKMNGLILDEFADELQGQFLKEKKPSGPMSKLPLFKQSVARVSKVVKEGAKTVLPTLLETSPDLTSNIPTDLSSVSAGGDVSSVGTAILGVISLIKNASSLYRLGKEEDANKILASLGLEDVMGELQKTNQTLQVNLSLSILLNTLNLSTLGMSIASGMQNLTSTSAAAAPILSQAAAGVGIGIAAIGTVITTQKLAKAIESENEMQKLIREMEELLNHHDDFDSVEMEKMRVVIQFLKKEVATLVRQVRSLKGDEAENIAALISGVAGTLIAAGVAGPGAPAVLAAMLLVGGAIMLANKIREYKEKQAQKKTEAEAIQSGKFEESSLGTLAYVIQCIEEESVPRTTPGGMFTADLADGNYPELVSNVLKMIGIQHPRAYALLRKTQSKIFLNSILTKQQYKQFKKLIFRVHIKKNILVIQHKLEKYADSKNMGAAQKELFQNIYNTQVNSALIDIKELLPGAQGDAELKKLGREHNEVLKAAIQATKIPDFEPSVGWLEPFLNLPAEKIDKALNILHRLDAIHRKGGNEKALGKAKEIIKKGLQQENPFWMRHHLNRMKEGVIDLSQFVPKEVLDLGPYSDAFIQPMWGT